MISFDLDQSTLKALHPLHYEDPALSWFKTSLRMQGSLNMSLRRPSRSPEFSRQYRPGDPLTLIDWKAFARTDQLIIREKRDEACAEVTIFVDVSDSMVWPYEHKLVPTKLELGLRVGCHLAASHLSVGDLVSVWLLGGQGTLRPTDVLVVKSPSDVINFFSHIENCAFTKGELKHFFRQGEFYPQNQDLSYLISDGLTPMDLGRLFTRVRQPLFLHILSSLEEDISWLSDDIVYFDEGAEKKEYLGRVLKTGETYHERLKTWSEGFRETLRSLDGDYLRLTDRSLIATYAQSLRQCFRLTGGPNP